MFGFGFQNFVPPKTEIYLILAPPSFRPNSKYHVSVSLLGSQTPITIKLGIQGSKYENFQTVELQPLTTKVLTYTIPRIKKEDYYFLAEGIQGLIFSQKKPLEFINKSFFPVFQTDKSTYKPGDLVRYRIFFLDPFLQAVKLDGETNFAIQDAKKNRLKLVKGIKTIDSVYCGKFELSDCPNLGGWSLIIEYDEQTFKKDFQVEEYVLPKFEVIVEAPKMIFADDKKINATVRAKYTFGKPVIGDAIVKLGNCMKTISLDGAVNVEFDSVECFGMILQKNNKVTLNAKVTSKLTQETNEGNCIVELKGDRYLFKTIQAPSTCNPNSSFLLKIQLVKIDGDPLEHDNTAISLFFEPNDFTTDQANLKECNFNEHGIVVTNITPPDISTPSGFILLKARYRDFTQTVATMRTNIAPMLNKPVIFPTDSFIKAKVLDSRLTVDQECRIQIESSSNVTHFSYSILARGDILMADMVQIGNHTEYTLKIKLTYDFIPTAKIFIYAACNGELLSTNCIINVEKDVPNHIQLNVPDQVKPGEEVEIDVTSGKNSFVGLLGIDKSSALLNNKNELTISNVFEELHSYWNLSENQKSTTFGQLPTFGNFPARQSEILVLTNLTPKHLPVPRSAMLFGASTTTATFGVQSMQSTGFGFGFNNNAAPIPIVRKEFPEVWLWDDIFGKTNNGRFNLKRKVPDTITTWLLSAVTLDPVTGLNIMKTSSQLKVFQPFFISMNLPYSIKRGETCDIPVTIFNYLKTQLKVEIILDNSKQEFDFITNQDNTGDGKIEVKELEIEPNFGKSTSFLIRPKKVGRITLFVTALSLDASDAIKEELLVEPEGITQYVNKAFLVDLRDKSQQQNKILINLPKDIVPDSTHIYITAIGDLLGPTISNLKDLVRVPYGCGEQNMVNFVPNILVLKYFKEVRHVDNKVEANALKHMTTGYQRQLTYRHSDGSYSTFGPGFGSFFGQVSTGSTCLTAYVIRSFRQASEFIHIDETIIKYGLEYLKNVQTDQGTFPEVGKPYSLPIPKDEKNISITAFALLAFIENSLKYPEYKAVIQKGLNFLAENIKGFSDPYILAITALALSCGKHKSHKEVTEILLSVSKTDGDRMWWEKLLNFGFNNNSLNVEITSYGLLALLENDTAEPSEFLPILKWLLEKRNNKGGFYSSFDTVMGLQAVTKAAQKVFSKDNDVEVAFKYNEDEDTVFKLDKDNSTVLQTTEIPENTRDVEINSVGSGISLVQISYKYNVKTTVGLPSFKIIPKIKCGSMAHLLNLSFAVSFIPNEMSQHSKMALFEVNLPSGYVVDMNSLKELINSNTIIQKVETKRRDTLIVIYFDYLSEKEISVEFRAIKVYQVEDKKPASAILYDYYDTGYRAQIYYSLPEKSE